MLLNTTKIAQPVIAVANVAVVSARAFAVCASAIIPKKSKPMHSMPAWHHGFCSEQPGHAHLSRHGRPSSGSCVQRSSGSSRRSCTWLTQALSDQRSCCSRGIGTV